MKQAPIEPGQVGRFLEPTTHWCDDDQRWVNICKGDTALLLARRPARVGSVYDVLLLRQRKKVWVNSKTIESAERWAIVDKEELTDEASI
jgi:hypothetical protein